MMDYEALRQGQLARLYELTPEYIARLTWPVERLRAERTARLRALVGGARARSPWHRRRLAAVDVDLDVLVAHEVHGRLVRLHARHEVRPVRIDVVLDQGTLHAAVVAEHGPGGIELAAVEAARIPLRELLDEHSVAQPLHRRGEVGMGVAHARHRNVAR